MLFNSPTFFVFFLIVFVLYRLLPFVWQNRMLLVASYVFYGWWDWRFLSLIALSTVVDFAVSRRLAATNPLGARRAWLTLSVCFNLGVLAFFKYFDFFTESAAGAARVLGIEWHPATMGVILPVGISFYTFQTMSYTIDVFRGRIEPARSLRDFALFVAFFPQLVAGPIERASHLLPQLQRPRPKLLPRHVQSGIALIVLGLFRKVVIADTLAPLVDRIFGLAQESSWESLVIGVLAFALQIYGDFAGYTAIARGVARLLGIDLMKNFDQPYLSRNITEFWRRWHISLSAWLRDYLYVPLGGNRGSRVRTSLNLMVVMLLGGLWHGAAWTFVVWGGLHGVMLALHRALVGDARWEDRSFAWMNLLAVPVTFGAVCFTWIFFRASSINEALAIVSRIVTREGGFFDILDAVTVMFLLVVSFAVDALERVSQGHGAPSLYPVRTGVATGVALAAVLVAAGTDAVPFIYFQF